jgi:hypothetical protein
LSTSPSGSSTARRTSPPSDAEPDADDAAMDVEAEASGVRAPSSFSTHLWVGVDGQRRGVAIISSRNAASK